MANFKTHRNVAIFISAMFSILLYIIGIIGLVEIVYLTIIGAVAGLLPDLDHSESIPNEALFNILGALSIILSALIFYNIFELHIVLAISIVVYLFVRYFLKFIYHKIVVHRGMFHSLPSALLISVLLINFLVYSFDYDLEKSIIMGLFVFIGYITHLILDEMYSVDFYNSVIKRSFGSAFKLFSTKYVFSTIVVYVLLGISLYYLPEKENVVDIIYGQIIFNIYTLFY